MTGFLAGASILLALALVVLLRPLLRRDAAEASNARAQINARIYRNQLAELDIDRANGILDPSAYDQSRRELERRALEDIGAGAAPAPRTTRWPALVLVAIVPLAAVLTYVALGTPAAIVERADEHALNVEKINRMVADLAQRLERNPGDLKGWIMLGRSYKTMGRLPEAIQAFERAGSAIDTDPQYLVDFAEALARTDKENFHGRGMKLVERALELNPDHLPALVFAGSAAFDRSDFKNALRYWQKASTQVPPDSDEARALTDAMARASAAMGPGKSAGTPVARAADKSGPAAADAAIRGVVSLAPALAGKAGPEDTLFVFARAAEGPRAPLAVMRAKVKDLPLKFALDDTQAMSPELRISLFKRIRVEARISRGGNAAPQSGDLQGASAVVAAGTRDLQVVIEQLVP
jgi:cytochrome c-type biogenesis protein CcmH